MKKIFNNLFNIFWIIFVGLGGAFTSILLGCIYCVTIIGIPFGTRYFKFTKLVFAPAGKIVTTNYGKHPVLNTLWLIFGGGLASWFSYSLMIIFFYITIIGIPIAKQLKKVRKYYLAPFGATILKDDEENTSNENSEEKVEKPKPVKYDFKSFYKEEKYSPLIYQKNLLDKERFASFYDFKLLFRRICADPHKKMVSQNGESTQTVAEYLKSCEAEIKKTQKKYENIGVAILAVIVFLIFAIIPFTDSPFLILGVIMVIVILFLALIAPHLKDRIPVAFLKPYFYKLFEVYPDNSPLAEAKYSTTYDVFEKANFENNYRSLL